MRTLFFDCASGISGNMALGALLELVGDENYLVDELKKLNVDGYEIKISKRMKNGITGTHVDVLVDGKDEYGHERHPGHEQDEGMHHECGVSGEHGQEEYAHGHEGHDQEGHHHGAAAHGDRDQEKYHHGEHAHGNHDREEQDHEGHFHEKTNTVQIFEEHRHEGRHQEEHPHESRGERHGHHHHGQHEQEHGHHHHHPHRNLRDVNEIIDHSTLDDKTKDLAKRIFLRVARAESKVHDRSLEEVHFHEVGAIDSIIDIVGTAILVNKINPARIMASVVNEGHGFIECAHGTMGVPVPATSEIFSEGKVKFRQIDIDTELVTPTGAAIIAELAEGFGMMPSMRVEKTGWGAGTKDLRIPNVLKVFLGEEGDDEEEIAVMETNMDDCSGEILGYVMEKLMESGARDVFFTPIFMKKNRPAYRLTVVCMPKDLSVLQEIIFRETTTIGIRYRYERRTALERENIAVDTEYGQVKAKKVKNGGREFVYPEYESLKELAGEHNVPIKTLYNEVKM